MMWSYSPESNIYGGAGALEVTIIIYFMVIIQYVRQLLQLIGSSKLCGAAFGVSGVDP